MNSRFAALCAAVLFATAASATLADVPPPSPSPAPIVLPTIAPNTNPIVQSIINAIAGQVKAGFGWEDNRAVGQVTFFHRFDMQVKFTNGQYRTIHLHQGTVINPRGASIQVGQRVDVRGQGVSDGSLNADTILLQ